MATKSSPFTGNPVYPVMFAIGGVHLLNDSLQAVIPAMFPILEDSMGLTFTQLGLIAFALNMVASVLQPVVGYFSDRKPMPYALPIGMTFSLVGIAGLAFAPQYWMILVFVICLGFGSAVFHPEGSRVSFMSAGSKRGLSQSIYQVGGNSGQALAPLISAYILVPFGQRGAAFFIFVAALAIFILMKISAWYKEQLIQEKKNNRKKVLLSSIGNLTKKQIGVALGLLLVIIFARSFYVISITNFYIFHLMESYGLSISKGQLCIFLFLALGATGTFFGGPMADKIGRKNVIVLSIALPIPLCALLPYVPLWAVIVLLGAIGFIIMLSFSVTVVYAQELVPSKIGTMAGLTVGLAFGMGAIGSVVIGILMDSIGIYQTMIVISLLPIIGLVGLWLPRDQKIVAS
ncbi:MFS transporter [Sporosarcina pasteurii]|uniref:Fosmidomycin resistance protein n=1 Tax=Sporosarcina pasteurii TaxID=1474 RepID=A0A380C6T1_SPOPA|nr:MFS transporter [Sporosarcina pasteurii]MDS9471816.1 MFS transporter [Sporosarcina pasteurii]QBQ04593.1 MFS transporter [Sporosarcina pasteurii]SUJ13958.1 Fosmidomycin resistance protein [Sporosarcina pasteurii]